MRGNRKGRRQLGLDGSFGLVGRTTRLRDQKEHRTTHLLDQKEHHTTHLQGQKEHRIVRNWFKHRSLSLSDFLGRSYQFFGEKFLSQAKYLNLVSKAVFLQSNHYSQFMNDFYCCYHLQSHGMFWFSLSKVSCQGQKLSLLCCN